MLSVKKFILLLFCLIAFWVMLLAKPGSCEQYAELVCKYCGEDSAACSEIREKSKKHPEDAACAKGVKLLPTVMEGASEEDKAKVLRTLCKKEVPKDLQTESEDEDSSSSD